MIRPGVSSEVRVVLDETEAESLRGFLSFSGPFTPKGSPMNSVIRKLNDAIREADRDG